MMKPYGVGIDCHSKFIQVCILVPSVTQELRRWEASFATTWLELLAARHWIHSVLRLHVPEACGPEDYFEFTIESTGNYHLPILKALAGSPSVVNPLLASPSRRKTDRLDAQLLSYHALTGLWPKSFLVTEQIQIARVLWNRREDAVRHRTRITNQINNTLLRFGHTLGAQMSVASDQGRAISEDLCAGVIPVRPGVCPYGLPVEIRPVLASMYEQYDFFDQKAKYFEQACLTYVKGVTWSCADGRAITGTDLFPLLCSIPGIGPVSALVWLIEVVDPRRFATAKACAAYCGSDPSVRVSAGKVTSTQRRGGNTRMHLALLKSAQNVINHHNEPFGRWAYNLMKRTTKGGYKKAVNALARRLAMALFYVHAKGERFSYEKYTLVDIPNVPDMALEEMGLDTRFVRKLQALGFTTSREVVAAYKTTLAAEKGIGNKCLNAILHWINVVQVCSLRDESSDAKNAKHSSPKLANT